MSATVNARATRATKRGRAEQEPKKQKEQEPKKQKEPEPKKQKQEDEKLSGMIHAKQEAHFGPEVPYVHKYGPDDPVLLDSKLVDGLAKRGVQVAVRKVVVERSRGHGPFDPEAVWSERTELVHLVEGSAELIELDRRIAAAKATRAEWAKRAEIEPPFYQRYQPSSPCYDDPSSPSAAGY